HRERGAQSPGAQPGRPVGRPGDGGRRALGQACLAARHGARVFHQAPHQPSHHRAERRDHGLGPVRAEVTMGQKTHPIGFRLGATRTWSSRWFATKGYASLLHEDVKIRRFIKSSLYHAGISRIDIERSANRARITIFTARPGIIIGRKGAEVEKLKNEIQSRTAKEVYLNIEEVVHPELDAQLVAENVALQLQKRVAFRRARRKPFPSALRLGADGIRIACPGRLGGAEIARREWYREGRAPLHTIRADIDYGLAEAHTTFGAIGVKVWIFKGEVLPAQRAAAEG